ncbi:hypothetical protein LguiB_024798 [Lonicera macranthoides]
MFLPFSEDNGRWCVGLLIVGKNYDPDAARNWDGEMATSENYCIRRGLTCWYFVKAQSQYQCHRQGTLID